MIKFIEAELESESELESDIELELKFVLESMLNSCNLVLNHGWLLTDLE